MTYTYERLNALLKRIGNRGVLYNGYPKDGMHRLIDFLDRRHSLDMTGGYSILYLGRVIPTNTVGKRLTMHEEHLGVGVAEAAPVFALTFQE